MSTERFQQRFAELTERYRAQMAQGIAVMEAALGAIDQPAGVALALRTVEREAHTLAGSAATFGFPAVGAAAARLEDQARPLRLRAVPPARAELDALRQLIDILKALATHA